MKRQNHYIFLDLVRILAIIFIVIHHLVFYLGAKHFTKFNEVFFLRLSLGDIGVSLFIFLSGLTLTLSSLRKKNFSIISFYKKRVIRLYPLFWLIYLSFLTFYLFKSYLPKNVSILAIILAFLGMDGYLTSFVKFSNWYLIGEWFLGFIIILYLIYPLLYRLYLWNKKLLIIINIVIFYLSFQFLVPLFEISMRLIPLRLLEFSGGIYFSKVVLQNKKRHYFQVLIVSTALFILLTFFKSNPIHLVIFRLLLFDLTLISLIYLLFSYIKNVTINKKVIFLSDLSYSVFLVHHIIIARYVYNISVHRNVYSLGNRINSVYFYIMQILVFIYFTAIFFYYLEKIITKRILLLFTSKKNSQYA